MKFYFTYGRDHRPFNAGWTEVIAPDIDTARALFLVFHPPTDGPWIPCAGIYDEEQFQSTSMARKGSFGKRCVERITYERVVDDDAES